MKEHRFSLPFTSFGREHCISRRARSRVPAPCPCHSRGSGLGGISAPAHGRRNPPPPLLGLPANRPGPTRAEQQAAERRAGRLARYEAVVALRAQGRSRLAIAHELGLDRRTVSTWLAAGRFPERKPRASPVRSATESFPAEIAAAMRPGRTMRPRSSASTCAHTILLLYLLRLRLRSLEREGSQEPASVMKHGRSRCLPLVNLLELY
jgi:hypothetical protein